MPGAWPDDVREYYTRLARDRAWPESTAAAFAETVEYYRLLDESAPPDAWECLEHKDVEGAVWSFATVLSEGSRVVIRQIVQTPEGVARVYWWQRLEDQDGGLAEVAIWPGDPVHPLPTEEFDKRWQTGDSAE